MFLMKATVTLEYVFERSIAPKSRHLETRERETRGRAESGPESRHCVCRGRQTPGLSSLVGADRAELLAYAEPLLKFATNAVPERERSRTPFKILATAGMRLLPAALWPATWNNIPSLEIPLELDRVKHTQAEADKLYDALFEALQGGGNRLRGASGGPFRIARADVRTISGEDEAYYARPSAFLLLFFIFPSFASFKPFFPLFFFF